jgi:hypothetical protein
VPLIALPPRNGLTAIIAIAALLILPRAALAGLDVADCRRALGQDIGDALSCELRYAATQQERDRLRNDKSGVLRDLSCETRIALSKGDVFVALLVSRTVQLDPHRIACTL